LKESLESASHSIITNANAVTGLNSSLDNLYNTVNNSGVNFAVQLFSGADWHHNEIIRYGEKLADSHDAFDLQSGTFTAPVDGSYTFFFFARIDCFGKDNYLNAFKNDLKITIFFCHGFVDSHYTVVFALELKEGDRVAIHSGTAYVRYGWIKFVGFLLPSL